MQLWRELGVNSWPTFAIVGPNGKLLAQVAGEGRRKVLMISSNFSYINYCLSTSSSTFESIPASIAGNFF